MYHNCIYVCFHKNISITGQVVIKNRENIAPLEASYNTNMVVVRNSELGR